MKLSEIAAARAQVALLRRLGREVPTNLSERSMTSLLSADTASDDLNSNPDDIRKRAVTAIGQGDYSLAIGLLQGSLDRLPAELAPEEIVSIEEIPRDNIEMLADRSRDRSSEDLVESRIVEALLRRGSLERNKALTLGDLAKQLGMNEKNLDLAIKRLRDAGPVIWSSGVYRIVTGFESNESASLRAASKGRDAAG